ncbi:hypothetical protein SteCoe_38115 [Stentor coeruleus]|uniref:Protein kinase domain-containing protein n=1 Tax=Stentor coeruleus TaxID=5963 RepID=A0A1R2ALT2_9CILI|nr:hypothetical protein SteCoe_38115 [Stentor coeruleus]
MHLYHKKKFDILKKNSENLNIKRQNYAEMVIRLDNLINFKNIINKNTIKSEDGNKWYYFNIWKELSPYQCMNLEVMNNNTLKFKLYCYLEVLNKKLLLHLKNMFALLKTNTTNIYKERQKYAKTIRKLQSLINFKRIIWRYSKITKKEDTLKYFNMWKKLTNDKLAFLKLEKFVEIQFKKKMIYSFDKFKKFSEYQKILKVKLGYCIKNFSIKMRKKMIKAIKYMTSFIKKRFYENIGKTSNLPIYDQSDIDYIGMSLKSRNFGNTIINICEGEIKNNQVSIKIYQNNTDFSPIIDSIIIQDFLYLRSESYCFERILGYVYSFDTKMNSVMLITPWIENTLKDMINVIEIWPIDKKEKIIEDMIGKLLDSFFLMHCFKIHHLDINPENILIEKILVFNNSNNTTEEYWKPYITGIDLKVFEGTFNSNEIECKYKNYTKNIGFSDPLMFDLQNKRVFDKEKADVFSLGMTFLNAMIGRRFSKKLCNDESLLIKEVNNISNLWMKELILRMVKFDNEERLAMSEAYEMFGNRLAFKQSKNLLV